MTGKKKVRGFSLVEMIIVIAILSTAGLALQGLVTQFYKSNAYLFEGTAALDNARRGLTGSLRHLREASYGDDGSYPILAAATSSITFFADVDSDILIERVRYYLSQGTLYEGVTNSNGSPPSYVGQPETTATVIAFIANPNLTPLFRYYDEEGAELFVPIDVGSVASVAVMIQVDLNPNRAPNIFTLSGGATLRNLRNQ